MRISAISYVLVTTAVVGTTAVYCGGQRNSTQSGVVESAIDELSASDRATREAAKERIIQIGKPAVRPLVVFLKDLIEHRRERYAAGASKEDLDEAMKRLRETPDSDSDRKAGATRQVSETLITNRIKDDVCEVLGRLRAEDAISVLIEAMERAPGGSSWETMNAAMTALVRIGSPAVPQIIDAIQTAKERASAIPYGDGHPSGFFIAVETAKNQARASMVLGEIGDRRALPALETLRSSNENEWLSPYLDRAVTKINKE